mmetsp:Transcript_115352/g.229950  ORF Transcript_115352/g.229950 Transcript_115352/m.229950 type:complete len:206 (+) Transcript_115352:52-669(+)
MNLHGGYLRTTSTRAIGPCPTELFPKPWQPRMPPRMAGIVDNGPWNASFNNSGKQTQWSQGSVGHFRSECRPCAHSWRPAGCSKGENCEFCHMCGEREFYMRRQQRRKRRLKVGHNMPCSVASSKTALMGPGVLPPSMLQVMSLDLTPPRIAPGVWHTFRCEKNEVPDETTILIKNTFLHVIVDTELHEPLKRTKSCPAMPRTMS